MFLFCGSIANAHRYGMGLFERIQIQKKQKKTFILNTLASWMWCSKQPQISRHIHLASHTFWCICFPSFRSICLCMKPTLQSWEGTPVGVVPSISLSILITPCKPYIILHIVYIFFFVYYSVRMYMSANSLGYFVKSTHIHPLKVLHSSNQTLHRTLLNKSAMCRCSSFEKNGMSIPMWGDCSCYVMYTICNQHRPEASLARGPHWQTSNMTHDCGCNAGLST